MTALVVASPKGGVGKTTLALHLAHAFVKRDLRTLLIDADPQGAIGLSLSKKLNEAHGLATYMAEGVRLSDVAIRTRAQGFSIVPMGRIAPHEVESVGAALSRGDRFARLFQVVVTENALGMVDEACRLGGARAGAVRA